MYRTEVDNDPETAKMGTTESTAALSSKPFRHPTCTNRKTSYRRTSRRQLISTPINCIVPIYTNQSFIEKCHVHTPTHAEQSHSERTVFTVILIHFFFLLVFRSA